MPADWLSGLPSRSGRHVESDVEALSLVQSPLLAHERAISHVEHLSAFLGATPTTVRRAAIGYALYVLQLDAVQERSLRRICAASCERPPVGCCNANHHVIMSLSDVMIAAPSQDALHLMHVLGQLQQLEHEHSLNTGMVLRLEYCSRLSSAGCTLRLFKSPRCIHYLCSQVETALQSQYAKSGQSFAEAMHRAGNRTLATLADFTSRAVLQTAEAMLSAVKSS